MLSNETIENRYAFQKVLMQKFSFLMKLCNNKKAHNKHWVLDAFKFYQKKLIL